jgi:lipopolysaccharide export system permease protein
MVFVLLGAPIALRFPRGGVGLTIGVSLVVFGLYYMCLLAGESLASRGIVPPALSMWGANLIFALVGLALAARMGHEAGTSRGGSIGDWIHNMRLARKLKREARAGAPAPTVAP